MKTLNAYYRRNLFLFTSLALLSVSVAFRTTRSHIFPNYRKSIVSTHVEVAKIDISSKCHTKVSVSKLNLCAQYSDSLQSVDTDDFGIMRNYYKKFINEKMLIHPEPLLGENYTNFVIYFMIMGDEYDEAMKLLKKDYDKHRIAAECYISLMLHYNNESKHNEAQVVYNMMKQANVTVTNTLTGKILLKLLMFLNEFNDGCVVLQNMIESGIADDSICNILTQPYHSYQNATSVTSDIGYAALNGLMHMKKYREARMVMSDLQKRGVADSRCYELMIKGYTVAKEYDEVVYLYNTMKSSQIYVNYTHIGNDILTALLAVDIYSSDIFLILEEMKDNLRSDSSVYAKIISAYMMYDNPYCEYKIAQNIKIADDNKSYNISLQVYNQMKAHNIHMKNIHDARIGLYMLIETNQYEEFEMVKMSLLQYPEFNCLCLFCDILRYVSEEKYDKARESYESMKQSNISLTIAAEVGTVSDLLLYQQAYDEAEHLLFNNVAEVMNYIRLVNAYMDHGRQRDAERVYKHLKQLNLTLSHWRAVMVVLKTTIKFQDWAYFDYIINTMQTSISFTENVTYILWLKRHILVGNYNKALKLYDSIIRDRVSISDIELGHLVLNLLLQLDRYDDAYHEFLKLLALNVTTVETYHIFMDACMTSKKYEMIAGVYCLYLNVHSSTSKDKAILSGKSILDYLMKENQVALALAVATYMIEAGEDLADTEYSYIRMVLDTLSEDIKQNPELKWATELLQEMNMTRSFIEADDLEQESPNSTDEYLF